MTEKETLGKILKDKLLEKGVKRLSVSFTSPIEDDESVCKVYKSLIDCLDGKFKEAGDLNDNMGGDYEKDKEEESTCQ